MSNEQAKASIRGWIDQQYGELDRSSYYQLLQVPRDATEAAVRDGYYKLVARLHPDLYGDLLDPETRQKLVTVYSRLVEAYRILSDGKKRTAYDEIVARGKMRWTQEEERAPAKDPEAMIANPNARRLFKLGRAAVMSGDGKGAVMNLKLALSVEPASAVIKAELARAEALTKDKK